jgi:hypothetical protein
MKTTLQNQKKLSVPGVFASAGKFLMGILSWIITILFMIVVLIITDKKKHNAV